MSLRVAIIADDLTGALDSSVAFALHGLKTRVAVTPAAIAAGLADEPDVLAVNTASRALPPEAAAELVRRAASALADARPEVLFKKIDSRLKGNVGPETAAMAAAFDAPVVLAAPAVPDQGRITQGEVVVGRGVPEPLPIAPVFAGLGRPLRVIDAASNDELDTVTQRASNRTLLVGASGLAAALARVLGEVREEPAFVADDATLFAFGSRDAITAEQVDALLAALPDLAAVDLRQGRADRPLPDRLPALLRCIGPLGDDPDAVADLLADAVAETVARLEPKTLVVGGGDSALAVLARLGAEVLVPVAEPRPGMVVARLTGHASGIRCLVKSGGFGTIDTLLGLVESGPRARAASA
jgi:uncharacterized protein YgbK (DUF1537 family)